MLPLLLIIAAIAFASIAFVAFLFFRWLWRITRSQQPLIRVVFVAVTALFLLAIPYFVFDIRKQDAVFARVPIPLQAASIEYRNEKAWGLGFLPGDNETGFVVYVLTDASKQWAREQGSKLGGTLPGGSDKWRPTPVDDESDYRRWHPYDRNPAMMSVQRPKKHPPTIVEYIEKYGFIISIEAGRDTEADNALQTEGSFYAYGAGGSVTIVDPIRGKVYFAYVG